MCVGAKVVIHGDNWNAADVLARKAVAEDETSIYIPPYDDPLIWEVSGVVVCSNWV